MRENLSTDSITYFTSNTKSRLVLGTAQTIQRTPQGYWCYWFLTTVTAAWLLVGVCQNRHGTWDHICRWWIWVRKTGLFPLGLPWFYTLIVSNHFSHRCDFRGELSEGCYYSSKSVEVLGMSDKEKCLLLVCLFPTNGQLPQNKVPSQLWLKQGIEAF